MPLQRQDGRPQRFLDLLRGPPVVVLVKGADSNRSRAAGDGELELVGRPANEGGRSVQS